MKWWTSTQLPPLKIAETANVVSSARCGLETIWTEIQQTRSAPSHFPFIVRFNFFFFSATTAATVVDAVFWHNSHLYCFLTRAAHQTDQNMRKNDEEEPTHRQCESTFSRSFFLFVRQVCMCVCESINVITKNRLITITGRSKWSDLYFLLWYFAYTTFCSLVNGAFWLLLLRLVRLLYLSHIFTNALHVVHSNLILCTRSMPQVSAFEQMKTMLFRIESTPAFNRTKRNWWWVRLEWCDGFRCWFSHDILLFRSSACKSRFQC